jgi:serine/threonine protein kinase
MDDDRIFLEAVEMPTPADRAAYLDRVCAGDADLRARVEALLRSHEEAGTFLEGPLFDPLQTSDQALPIEGLGSRVGPYTILEKLGEGGMGTVYVAEQHEPVRRRVALKVIKPGMDSRQVVARFEAERQALAMMDHPSIAKIYDGGMTPSGRPYFVMELVPGVPITEYCDRERFTVRNRLGLFVLVCRAVQHAHQKGVIHRDLKPSNILVTLQDGSPVPKVIDFGIAKATGQDLTDKTVLTALVQLVGSPLYMSPEQAGLGEGDVDTRSDVYSLGVVLYELLTGTTPFDPEALRRAPVDDVRWIIREQEPPPPSARLSRLAEAQAAIADHRSCDPRALPRSLRNDLDWIAMKALEKDRQRRYETASALAADVQRYLHCEPVEAGPPSAWYRVRKFARRNRVALVTTSLVALSLIAGTAVSVRQARRAQAAERQATRERDVARERSRQARAAVDTMYTRVAEQWLSKQAGLEPLQREFLQSVVQFYESMAEDSAANPQLRRDGSRAYHRVGLIQYKLGQFRRSEVAFRRALSIQESLVREQPGHAEFLRDLAATLSELGRQYENVERRAEAESLHRRALEIRLGLSRAEPDQPAILRDLAVSYNRLGTMASDDKRFDEAICLNQRVLEIREHLADMPGATREDRSSLADSLHNTAFLMFYQGYPAGEFEHILRRCLTLRESLAEEEPGNPIHRMKLANHLNLRGDILWGEAHESEAERAFRRALALNEELAAASPSVPEYRQRVSDTWRKLGRRMAESGRCRDAEEALKLSLQISEEVHRDYPALTKSHLANTRGHLAWFLLTSPDPDCRDSERAESLVRTSIAQLPGHTPLASTLGLALYRQGKWPEAIRVLQPEPEAKTPGDDRAMRHLVLAMACARVGDDSRGHRLFDLADRDLKGVYLFEQSKIRLREEAAGVLGVSVARSNRPGRRAMPDGPDAFAR